MDDKRIAAVAHALGHPARVSILRMLASQDACMGAEVFESLPLAQSTISQHLGVLKRAGLIHATRHGTRMLYCITGEPLEGFVRSLDALVETHPVCPGEDA